MTPVLKLSDDLNTQDIFKYYTDLGLNIEGFTFNSHDWYYYADCSAGRKMSINMTRHLRELNFEYIVIDDVKNLPVASDQFFFV